MKRRWICGRKVPCGSMAFSSSIISPLRTAPATPPAPTLTHSEDVHQHLRGVGQEGRAVYGM